MAKRFLDIVAVIGIAISVAGFSSAVYAGDAAKGEKVYKKCKSCHLVDKEKHKTGPHLVNLFGRAAGSAEGYKKYSKAMNATVQTAEGENVPVQMGSYGIGVSRLVGGIIEACHDENGIVWPKAVSPFDVGLISMKPKDETVSGVADGAYAALQAAGLDVLYDETDERPGSKFNRMDLIGLPWQIVIGPRGVEAGMVEVKNRKTGEKSDMTLEQAIEMVKAD